MNLKTTLVQTQYIVSGKGYTTNLTEAKRWARALAKRTGKPAAVLTRVVTYEPWETLVWVGPS